MLTLQLIDTQNVTNQIRLMKFQDVFGKSLPAYSAGAHIDFELSGIGVRAYSLINWKSIDGNPKIYEIAVQREEDGDGGSQAMHQFDIGTTLKATEPGNDFALAQGSSDVLLLAGGIGVTPLISMATHLKKDRRSFQFHYSARTQNRMGFKERLEANFRPNMSFHFDNVAPLDLGKLMQEKPQGTAIYICGPKGMIEAARTAAEAAGHSNELIHVEVFSRPKCGSEDTAFEVEIKSSGEVFVIPPGQSIIDVLSTEGKDILYDCQRGDCGICQTNVINGIPDHRDVILSEADRKEGNIMQICVSRAKSARLVLDL